MITEQWFETTGKAHLQGFLKNILEERKMGTVSVERVMKEYYLTSVHHKAMEASADEC